MADKKSTSIFGLSENIASTLCYIPAVGWIISVVMLVMEGNVNVKWNAWQSLLLTGVVFVAGLALVPTIVLAALVPILNIAALIINLILAVKAYNAQSTRLPVLAGWVDKIVKKA